MHAIEEFFDEWASRAMVHCRWHYPASAAFAAPQPAHGDGAQAARLEDWGRRACRATGTETPAGQRAAEQEYPALMQAAERQLRETPYLLGERPTAVDGCVLGGLRAHTLIDPDPKARLAGLSTLIESSEWRANDTTLQAPFAPLGSLTPFADHVLRLPADTYQPFVLSNTAALAAGPKLFEADSYGHSIRYRCRRYPERSRSMVRERIEQTAPADRAVLEEVLATYCIERRFA